MKHEIFSILQQRQYDHQFKFLGEGEMECNCQEEATTQSPKEDDLQAAEWAKPLHQHPSQKGERIQS